ncbi:MAG: hypothetical protein ACE5GZ_02960 [Gammaproteobacteria bacterium]
MNNRERLIDLITEYKLDRLEIAEMVKVKRDTVDHWLLPNDAQFHENIPDMALELLQIKLKDYVPPESDVS